MKNLASFWTVVDVTILCLSYVCHERWYIINGYDNHLHENQLQEWQEHFGVIIVLHCNNLQTECINLSFHYVFCWSVMICFGLFCTISLYFLVKHIPFVISALSISGSLLQLHPSPFQAFFFLVEFFFPQC